MPRTTSARRPAATLDLSAQNTPRHVPAANDRHIGNGGTSAAPASPLPATPRHAGVGQPVPVRGLTGHPSRRQAVAARAFGNQIPVPAARFAHQIFHHAAEAKSAAEKSVAERRYLPAEAAADAAGENPWKSGLERTARDWQTQLRVRRQYLSRQTDQLRSQESSPRHHSDADPLFRHIDLLPPRRPELSLEMLGAAPAARLLHACGAGTHEADMPAKDEPAHEHAGMIAVDLDEAAHGAYASTKYLGDAFAGKPEQIMVQLREEASLLASAPKEAMTSEVLPHGVSDFSAAIGASAAMLPLAGMAIHAGIHEMRHARGEMRRLGTMEDTVRRDTAEAETLVGTVPGIENELALKGHARKAIAFAKRLARLDFGIGLSSALSGSAIAVKSALDIGFKATLVGLKNKFSFADTIQQGTQIGTAGLVTGAAGTLVLSPLAGIFAATLGIFFLRKSAAKHRQLKNDIALARQDLQTNLALLKTAGMEESRHVRYQDFVVRQADKRSRFFRVFRRWNRAFLVGSGLYAASATTKMGITAAAMAGVGVAASNPIGLGVLLGVGIAGALVMGGASLSFLTGHDKQGRFSRHTSQDHVDVDRDLLAALDLLRNVSQQGQPNPEAALKWSSLGMDVRSHCLQRLDVRKEALGNFLNKAAEAHGKLPHGNTGLHVWGKLSCSIRTGLRYAGTLAGTASLHEARLAAREARMVYRKDLGSRHLEKWIQSPEGEKAFLDFAREDLLAKTGYLARKLHARLEVTDSPLDQVPNLPDDASKPLLDAYASHVARQDGLIEKDQAELERCRALLLQIQQRSGLCDDSQAHQSDNQPITGTDQLITNLHDYFGAGADPATGGEGVERSLSKSLAGGLRKDVKEARGVLFETQLQASRIREASSKAATAPATAKPARRSLWKFLQRTQRAPENAARSEASAPAHAVATPAQSPRQQAAGAMPGTGPSVST